MDVNIDASSRVFFFIKKTEDLFGEVLVPDMAGISINKVRNKRGVGKFSWGKNSIFNEIVKYGSN